MIAHPQRLSVVLSALLVAGTAGIAVKYGGHFSPVGTAHAAEVAQAPRTEVDVATVVFKSVSEWQPYSGRLEAVGKVEIRPLVPGTLVAVHFKDGALVRKGEPLFSIDPRTYLAEVDRAAGQLAAAESRALYTATDAGRAARLVDQNAISKRDFDEKQNAAREASANVKVARAALDAARVNLSYTEITAPITGRVSRAELTVGNVVSAGAAAPVLTRLVSVSPIYASFDVDEQTYLRYLNQSSAQPAPVSLGLANEDGFSRTGVVDSIDNQLDTQSGTIRVRARFDNANGALLPGLYARLQVGGGKPADVVLVDDSAIGTDQAKKFVLLVGEGDKVEYREVTLGNLHEGLRIITSGLKAGDRVIVSGVQRVRPNDSVHANSVDMANISRAAKPAA
ncbi:MexE family multidrug efflux RND transporter periplasmic adaptor subunit [Pseudomonas gingeri NCPPB 3146 = LMG 5327]|uniref:Efflux RND transporter periplasmic adaptor subunit n=2 Tax=Pseudomonas gingeri TaxID=117681 RepID=A0A7Y7XUS0_9PSED|nr:MULTISPECIES: efflux RND transporter periplasmic adaptor subunit [Pseudomonas]NVZ60532.1 efflux RND transporter periplasmic adaptor subunit [Pseudomonas gingeri]NVZ73347.1 efflux RND transporter periplasmic adaptor subunit [Pseudomonas gingeri]NWC12693.1 efflux RND transporter periplasmic adaptor subunit [Pseudomonas gingeri]NWE49840.1 efflux RND transporter periplasmic adaptor subunit [Pseudomonas gingeri]PNQ92976.1 MexE family multidrug efflux RND transporter periplasmic adaptor subunit [